MIESKKKPIRLAKRTCSKCQEKYAPVRPNDDMCPSCGYSLLVNHILGKPKDPAG